MSSPDQRRRARTAFAAAWVVTASWLLTGCGRGNAPGARGDAGADARVDVGAADGMEADLPPPATLAWVFAGGSNRIDVFAADRRGTLTRQATVPAGDDARLVELDPRRRRAYVQTQMGTPLAVLVYPLAPTGAALGPPLVHPLPFPAVEGMTQMQVHPTEPWFMLSASNRDPGLEDQLMPVDPDGRLGMHRTVSYQFYGFTWDPSGRYFYGLDGEAIFQYAFDARAGTIAAADPAVATGSDGRVVLSLRPHPGGKWVYSVEESEIGQYVIDPARGTLSARAYLPSPLPDEPTYWTSAVVHPGGRFLYLLGYLTSSKATIVDLFAIDEATGGLRFVARQGGTRDRERQVQNTGLQAPLLLGEDLLIIGGPRLVGGVEGGPALVVYRIAGDGRLEPAGDPAALSAAPKNTVSFIFSPPPAP